MTAGNGPLAGVRVLEFAGLGPAPFCGMMLADLGADVVRIDRAGGAPYRPFDTTSRGRRSVALNLKNPDAVEIALQLAERADILIEGFRPGVMERLGLGPEVVHARKPSLVYGRMTGWGQTGPLAKEPGHDINYIAQAGALHAIGPSGKPAIPLNLVGDFGGGALYLAFGVMAALWHANATGKGQVVDCAMVDGTASLMTMLYGRFGADDWHDRRESNSIDGGSHFYNVYECKDGGMLAVGAIEPQFYANLLELMEFDEPDFHPQRDQANWPMLRQRMAERFRTKSREEWLAILCTKETCVSPILTLAEAEAHPANAGREMFRRIDGALHVMPTPRFSDSPHLEPGGVTTEIGADNETALADWGLDPAQIEGFRQAGALG